MQGRGQWRYDPSKAETIRGEVVGVKEFPSRNGMRKGVGLELNTGGQTILVHLGPRFYIDQQTVKIAAGDKVEITGVKTVIRGQDAFLAGEVRKSGQALELRDEKGVPLWAGSGPGGGKRY
jgi:DNA/RNA endonuclease YhcR with UshA esterase domain